MKWEKEKKMKLISKFEDGTFYKERKKDIYSITIFIYDPCFQILKSANFKKENKKNSDVRSPLESNEIQVWNNLHAPPCVPLRHH